MPSVSVIVPVYNRHALCRSAIQLLKNQTLPDIEFILVDDGSTDGTYEYLQKSTASDTRFILLRQSENMGPSAARNLGLRHAHGKYIGFFDIDDNIPSDYFAELYHIAQTHGSDIVFASYNNLRHYKTGLVSTTLDKIQSLRNGALWDKLFLREIITENDIHFPHGLYCADNVFVFTAFYFANSVYLSDSPSYSYTLTNDSIGFDPAKAAKRKSDIIQIVQIISNFIRDNKFDSRSRAEAYHFINKTFNTYTSDLEFMREFTSVLRQLKPECLCESRPTIGLPGGVRMWAKILRVLGIISRSRYQELMSIYRIRASGLFDSSYYRMQCPEISSDETGLILHYMSVGWRDGKNPSRKFDNDAYLRDNPDVASVAMCPLLHYITHGHGEGRYVRQVQDIC